MTTVQTDEERHEAAYVRFKAEYLSGANLARNGFPDPVARYHGGPITARSYGAIHEAVGRFAGQSDWHAAAAREVFGSVNLYATTHEALAQVTAALARFAREGYTDVVGMTGPEAGRRSQYTDKPMTEWQMLLLNLLQTEVQMAVSAVGGNIGFVPGVGWVLDRWMREQQGGAYSDGRLAIPHYFPHLLRKYVTDKAPKV